MYMAYRILAPLILAIAVILAPTVSATQTFTAKAWVNDLAGVMDVDTAESLDSRLEDLNRNKGAQLGILIVPSTNNESIESFAERVFRQWGLGRKNIDDGVLLIIAVDDKQMRIEVGYGLEGAIPDITAGRIISDIIAPYFQQDNYTAGVLAGADALITLINGEELPLTDSSSEEFDEGDIVALLLFSAVSLAVPWFIGAFMLGMFCGLAFGSLWIGILGALAAIALRIVAHLTGIASKINDGAIKSGGPGGRGGPGGPGGGFGGGFGGGGSGGTGGGGGGSSGGGGASGGW